MKKIHEGDRVTVFAAQETPTPPDKVAVVYVGCDRWLRGRKWEHLPYITVDIVSGFTAEEAAKKPGAITPSAEGGTRVCLVGQVNRLDLNDLVSLLKPKW